MAVHRPEEAYLLQTDASNDAVGASLVQNDETGMERVTQYVSHSLSQSQRRWSCLERERRSRSSTVFRNCGHTYTVLSIRYIVIINL